VITAESCRELDQADQLSSHRALFDLPQGMVYLDGNSLGPQPKSVPARIEGLLHQWRSSLTAGWIEHGWADLAIKVGARLGPVIGAEPGSVVACDSTTVNLFKAADAACRIRSGDLLTDSGNFPTDLYVLAEVARRHGRVLRVVAPGELISSTGPGVGVTAITQVDFKTGRLHDLPGLTASIHASGGVMICDLSHSAGVMPIDLAGTGVDLGVGCSYKYLNGGPGAPGYIYVSPELQQQIGNPITGWFGHEDPFLFAPTYRPASGPGRMQAGTPPILSLVGLDEALAIFADVDLNLVRTKSVGLTSVFIDLADQVLDGAVEVVTPRSARERGSHVALRHSEAPRLVNELASRGVIVDHRPPDLVRVGFSPLFNSYSDVWEAASALSEVLRA
jgi:kynureninase